jgi:hypothetical protein
MVYAMAANDIAFIFAAFQATKGVFRLSAVSYNRTVGLDLVCPGSLKEHRKNGKIFII